MKKFFSNQSFAMGGWSIQPTTGPTPPAPAARPVAERRPPSANKQESNTKPASREACRRAAADFGQQTRKQYQTGEPWHLLCHGGKTPAKFHVSLRPCAQGAQFGVQGFSPATAETPRPSLMSPYTPARWRRDGCIKASAVFKSRWPLLRAMRPVAEWRSVRIN